MEFPNQLNEYLLDSMILKMRFICRYLQENLPTKGPIDLIRKVADGFESYATILLVRKVVCLKQVYGDIYGIIDSALEKLIFLILKEQHRHNTNKPVPLPRRVGFDVLLLQLQDLAAKFIPGHYIIKLTDYKEISANIKS